MLLLFSPIVATLVVTLLGFSSPSGAVNVAELYVKPSWPNSTCPEDVECHTLEEYAGYPIIFKGREIVSLLFLDGVHNLATGKFQLSDKQVVNWMRSNNSGFDPLNPQVVINCSFSITLNNITHILLREMNISYSTFHNCADNCMLIGSTNFEVQNVIFESAYVEIHPQGKSNTLIADAVFHRSLLHVEYNISTSNVGPTCTIQDTIFVDAPTTSSFYYKSNTRKVKLILEKVSTKRKNIDETDTLTEGPGDITVMLGSDVRDFVLKFTQCNITQSPGYGIFVETPDTSAEYTYHLKFDGVVISDHNEGGAVFNNYKIESEDQDPEVISQPFNQMRDRKTNLAQLHALKTGRPIKQHTTTAAARSYTKIEIVSCEFARNNALYTEQFQTYTPLASGLTIINYGAQFDEIVSINDTIFDSNNAAGLEPVTVLVYNTQNVEIRDCDFKGNIGSGIQAYFSEITLSGNVTFVNNSAYRGGAIALYLSYLHISESNTQVHFHSNKASDVGGAIVVEQHTISQTRRCFYRIAKGASDIQLQFFNNSAGNGGQHLYGASLKSDCLFSDSSSQTSYSAWRDYFNFEKPTSLSDVTSDPTRVCFCNATGYPNCTQLTHNISLYPGQIHKISAAVVGADFGTIPGSVHANFLNTGVHLKNPENTQWIANKTCSQLQYTVFSSNRNEMLVLRVEANEHNTLNMDIHKDTEEYINNGHITSQLLSAPVNVSIDLEECPLGFVLSPHTHTCDCDPKLTEKSISCNISTGEIYRSGTRWVGYNNDGGTKEGVLIHMHCPYQYCNENLTPVNLSEPDTQCLSNRTGTICGQCQKGFSLAIGSSRCLENCTPAHLALLLYFALAGILLVAFLTVLDLTVKKGTLNGLILYANIIWTYQSMLFPTEDDSLFLYYFTKPFIAWLNLDFGIESCFIKELDALQKACLQFLFPVYIWGIVGLMIIVAHCSSFITSRLSKNFVDVLATLVLLSYTKLLRAIITAVVYTPLKFPDGSMSIVWAADGTMTQYHALLSGAAIAILVLIWIPLTVVIFLHQRLKKVANHRRLSLIVALKTFFETFFGPLKDNHHYWVGLMLLTRCFLLITYAVTSGAGSHPPANLLAMIITMVTLLVYVAHVGGVYKNRYLSLLENSFIINLIVVGAATLYLKINGVEGKKEGIIHTSIIIAFVQFVGIIIYHIWLKRQPQEENGNVVEENNHRANHVAVTQGEEGANLSPCREPLVEYEQQKENDTY